MIEEYTHRHMHHLLRMRNWASSFPAIFEFIHIFSDPFSLSLNFLCFDFLFQIQSDIQARVVMKLRELDDHNGKYT